MFPEDLIVIGLFARADHPRGYGFGDGTAHGYSVLLVRCKDRKELELVKKRLEAPFYGIEGAHYYSDGAMGEWYGGRFELIALFPGNKVELRAFLDWKQTGRAFSVGDNRFYALFEASEVLADEPL